MQVDKGVPIPPSQSGRKRGDFPSLEVGDSVFCDTRDAAKRACNLIYLRHGKGSVCSRTVDGGFRVWRIK